MVASHWEHAPALARCPVYVAGMDLASIPGASTPSRAIWELAMRASAAWSSQDPQGVAACYEETASLMINNGGPATGRAELAATAAGYMEAFPDLQVTVDQLHVAGDSAFWVWTLTGTNNGPGGTVMRCASAASRCGGSRIRPGGQLDRLLRRRHIRPSGRQRRRRLTRRRSSCGRPNPSSFARRPSVRSAARIPGLWPGATIGSTSSAAGWLSFCSLSTRDISAAASPLRTGERPNAVRTRTRKRIRSQRRRTSALIVGLPRGRAFPLRRSVRPAGPGSGTAPSRANDKLVRRDRRSRIGDLAWAECKNVCTVVASVLPRPRAAGLGRAVGPLDRDRRRRVPAAGSVVAVGG